MNELLMIIISIIVVGAVSTVIIMDDAHAWFINVPPSQFPLGEVAYFNTTGTTITILGQSDGFTNMAKIDPVTSFVKTQDFSNGGADDGTLEYTGKIGKYFHIAASISTSATNNNDVLIYSVAKNGVPMDTSKIMMKLGQTTDVTSSAMHVVAYLEEGDTVEIYVGNYSGTHDVIIKSLNFVAVSMK